MKKSTLRAIAETVGKVFNSNSYGKFTVTSYEHSTRVHILFEATGGVNIARICSVRDGWTVDVVVEFFKGLLGDNK